MMRDMQTKMGPGGMKPDELGAAGAPPDISGILETIESAPPQVLMLLKQAIDAKLAMAQGGGAPGGPPPGGGAPPPSGPAPMQ